MITAFLKNTTFYVKGACMIKAPTITSKIELSNDEGKCWMEWEKSAKCLNELLKNASEEDCGTKKNGQPKIKYTIPGPMTLVDVLFDDFYGENNQRELIEDLITCLNKVKLVFDKYFNCYFNFVIRIVYV